MEVPDCAAIRINVPRQDGIHNYSAPVVFAGKRHSDCFVSIMASAVPRHGHLQEQGFMTTAGRFVSRMEAFRLFVAAGRESVAEGGFRGEELYSEDLY